MHQLSHTELSCNCSRHQLTSPKFPRTSRAFRYWAIRALAERTALVVEAWAQQRRQRRAQSALDDCLPREVGISRTRAQSERSKSPWQAYARRHLK